MINQFRLEEKESFRVLGYKLETTNQKKAGMKAIPVFWQDHQQDVPEKLLPMMNQEPFGVFGVNVYNVDSADARKFHYLIAVSSDCTNSDIFTEYTVPAALWAIFPCTKETIGKTEVMAISKWLPKNGYTSLNSGYLTGRIKSMAPDIEYYGQGDEVEVWIAVRKK